MQPRRIKLPSGEVVAPEDLPNTAVRAAPSAPTPKPLVVADAPAAPVRYPQTDLEVLDAIMSKPKQLSTMEFGAFRQMRTNIVGGKITCLSHKQRYWAQYVAARLGFDVEDPR